MSIETKRGYRITQIAKEVIIECPTVEEAKVIFDSLKINIIIGQWKQKMGKVRKFEPHSY